VLVVVAFTFVGTAFDEVLDPKLRKREEHDADRPLTVEGEGLDQPLDGIVTAPGSPLRPILGGGSSSSGNKSDDPGGPQ
jgi:hypothetical protein